ncbi:MAG: cyclohexanecarboxylate-CoA ligase [Porticoccaceae bacterium]
MTMDPILPPERVRAMRAAGWWRERYLYEHFAAAVAAAPERIAVVDYRTETGARHVLRYRELDDRVARIAAALQRLGIRPGEVVSFQLPNWWEFVAIHLACLRIGAVSNPLMPIFRERELGFMVDFAESRVLIVPARFRGFDHEAMIAGMRTKLPKLEHLFVVGGEGDNAFETALLGFEPVVAAPVPEPDPSAVIMLMYTSGTTGMPKGVMHCSYTLDYNVARIIERCRLTADDVIFMGSPLAHLTGFLYGMWMPMMLGATMVLQDVWQPETAWRLIGEERVSFAMGATPFLADLTHSEARKAHNSDRFRLFVCGGAPIPRVLAEHAARELDIALMAVWGMTECGAITTTRLDDPPEKLFGTDGLIAPGSEVRVVDPEGKPLPPGVEGRLLQRGPATFIGYLKRPEAYDVDAEGFFDTGDLARMDADGYIRITGRSKDIIIRGGENIPVVEVENLLYKHPAIADCAVVAMPDERLGELGCCFVTLNPGASLDFGEMIAFLRGQGIAKNYLPERLEVVAAMPRTASGKIQKFELREIAKQFHRQRAS